MFGLCAWPWCRDATSPLLRLVQGVSFCSRITHRHLACMISQMVVGLTVSGGAAMGTITAALLHLHGQAVLSLFTSDPAVLGLALSAWPVVALSQPLTTLAFSYDGLLFGANDFRFCALLMVISAHCNDCLRWLLDLLCLALTRRSPGHRLVSCFIFQHINLFEYVGFSPARCR